MPTTPTTAPFPAAAPFGVSRIGQIAITIHDIDRATAFYRDALGMKMLFAVPGMSFFDAAGIRIMLAMPSTPDQDHPGSQIYFTVDDIHAAYETLKGRGVSFIDRPHFIAPLAKADLWITSFHDLDKNTLSLMSEIPRT